MTTWYDPDEIKAEADGAQRQPEFAPEVIEEDPITEGVLSDEKMVALIDRSAEVKAIVDTVPKEPEPSH